MHPKFYIERYGITKDNFECRMTGHGWVVCKIASATFAMENQIYESIKEFLDSN